MSVTLKISVSFDKKVSKSIILQYCLIVTMEMSISLDLNSGRMCSIILYNSLLVYCVIWTLKSVLCGSISVNVSALFDMNSDKSALCYVTLWKCQNCFIWTLKLSSYCFLGLAYLWTCLKLLSALLTELLERRLFLTRLTVFSYFKHYFLFFNLNEHLIVLLIQLAESGSHVGHLNFFYL